MRREESETRKTYQTGVNKAVNNMKIRNTTNIFSLSMILTKTDTPEKQKQKHPYWTDVETCEQ